ncbi:unnamed protein product [Orchesella dallaii]|uniref:Uncharacterized protein n=1 Tax=Orchesella dallaii TaxID=48710 RepID=A0ABP1PWV5_9HEXA
MVKRYSSLIDGKKEILVRDLLGAKGTTICVRRNCQPFSPSDARTDNMIYVNSINITNSVNLSIRETRVNGPSFAPITPPENLAAVNESDDGAQEEEQPLSATVPVQNSELNQVQCLSMVVNAVDSAMESASSSTVPQFNQYCWLSKRR